MSEIDLVTTAIEDGVPPPLSPLTDIVISPSNIAAEARRQRAQTLPTGKRARYRRELAKVTKQLDQADYDALAARCEEIRPELEQLRYQYQAVKQALADQPENEDLLSEYEELRSRIAPRLAQWRALDQRVRVLQPLAERRSFLTRSIEDHHVAVARQKAEKRLRKLMEKEARIYEQLIIDKWTRLGFCYRRTVDGKESVDKVQFSEIAITLDAIYYKIDSSYQTAFKNWKTNLPQGVYIVGQLLSEATLDELTITCQRQVSGIYNTNGAWVVVHRLDSVDGLMNYVSFSDVLVRYPNKHHSRMPICVGVAAQRQVQWVNLADFPHWLIAGFTNSGKSNMVNAGLCTLITKQKPDDLRLILIDLKGGLEFDFYKGIPHLHGDVVDSVAGVADVLAQLEALMHSRFVKFRGIAKRLEEYQAKRPKDVLPRVLVVFDEVASIMEHGDLSKRIMASLRELTRMGRAVGIHIWLCTQRPDVRAIDGAVKANLAVRISGRMTTTADSVTILGNSMAKDLAPIAGRMVMQIGPDPVTVQTPHITEVEITDALRAAGRFEGPAPLDIPEGAVVVHQQWTVERVIELSLKHLDGNITAKRVWEAADDLSKNQARSLVEKIWKMRRVEFDGQVYQVEVGAHNRRMLMPVQPEALPAGSDVQIDSSHTVSVLETGRDLPDYLEN